MGILKKILSPRYLFAFLVIAGVTMVPVLQSTPDQCVSTTEAVNPQAAFFIQVQNNSIVRSDKINVGDNLSSTLLQWTGPLQNSVVE